MRTPFIVATLLCAGAAAAASPAHQADLVAAIRGSDYAGVSALLKRRATDPNRLLPDGSTALSWASEVQDPQMVRLLLAAKAKPDAASNSAASPLALACEHGNAEVLALLLDAGADVHRVRDDGIAPLAICAGKAPVEIVARMLDAGAQVEHADQRGQTALMWAAARGRVETFHLLMTRGANVNRVSVNGFTPLFFALKSGNPAMSAAALASGGDAMHVGPEQTTAVQLAMYQKDYAFVATMLAKDADLAAFDRNGHTLLQAAVLAQRPELVKQILARGADPDVASTTPRVVWRYEANFKSTPYQVPVMPALLFAARQGDADMMQILIDAGADTQFRMADGTNVLHAAVSGGHLATVALALRVAPDANAVDQKGRTPLHVLLLDGSDEPGNESAAIMRLLAASGARTDIRTSGGKTAADLARTTAAALRVAYDATFSTRTAAL